VDRLKQRCQTAQRALALLEELAKRPHLSPLERDAAIQRFEYTFESVWKAVQPYLREVEGLVVGSPKRAARASLQSQLLNEEETRNALTMVDDRNQTVHTYNEELAEQLAGRLPQHAVHFRPPLLHRPPRRRRSLVEGCALLSKLSHDLLQLLLCKMGHFTDRPQIARCRGQVRNHRRYAPDYLARFAQ